MPTITFYRQARRDGGIRTGIDVDENSVLGRFDPGDTYDDPTLLWYVDVRCTGARVPRDAEAARSWLIEHQEEITGLLSEFAQEMPFGSDPGDWTSQRSRALRDRSRITVTCSAVRRSEARRMAGVLRDLARTWRRRVQALAPVTVG